jgi:predicted acylesterase/phospholipase RssA
MSGKAPDGQAPTVSTAQDYLRGAVDLTPEEVRDLAKRLDKADRFDLARRVLARVRETPTANPSLRRDLAQRHAKCTYKDPDLPVLFGLDKALEILAGSFELKTTTDQETLGLTGAIHKRRWEATGQKDELERAYRYYRRGYDVGPETDQGYTGVNAAFVLDQLAAIETTEGAPSVANRRAEAKAIRQRLVEALSPLVPPQAALDENAWWLLVTLAEAHFGLGLDDPGHYETARELLKTAKSLPNIPDWQLRTTATQLAALYQLQRPGKAPDDPAVKVAADVLNPFLGSAAAWESAFLGKIGLALSGGGFRASLFHIGVLAKLAEADVLRRVEVLSCVSGGSIIGAHYYLQLREWMGTTDVGSLTVDELRAAYIGIMQRVATDFLAGVQSNIRMRVFANPFPLLRSVFDRAYTRTTRLGELLESCLFAKIWKGTPPESPLLLKDLRIQPKDVQGAPFEPKVQNWRRNAKVPILILNATTLNTGHAWQYTASFMGESPWAIDPNIDGTRRLRRFYHHEAPPAYQSVPFHQAVVASACVPGLFDPVRLDGLYELRDRGRSAEPLVLRQVDGGVHDNQGVGGLLEQGCSVLLVSDASGQTTLSIDPGGGVAAPLTRSNSVLMERVRQEQFARLDAMDEGGLLKGVMILHLKRDLDATPVDWVGCEEPPEGVDGRADAFTGYGVRKDVQALLAGIRTDLDSFSDVEAYSLMTSGYRMADTYLRRVQILPRSEFEKVDWPFLAMDKVIHDAKPTDKAYLRTLALLRSGGSRLFRVWGQSRALLLSTGLLGAVAVVSALIALWRHGWEALSHPLIALTGWGALALVGAAVALAFPSVREHTGRISIGLLGLVLWIPAWIQLWVFDPIFLRFGRLERILRSNP